METTSRNLGVRIPLFLWTSSFFLSKNACSWTSLSLRPLYLCMCSKTVVKDVLGCRGASTSEPKFSGTIIKYKSYTWELYTSSLIIINESFLEYPKKLCDCNTHSDFFRSYDDPSPDSSFLWCEHCPSSFEDFEFSAPFFAFWGAS